MPYAMEMDFIAITSGKRALSARIACSFVYPTQPIGVFRRHVESQPGPMHIGRFFGGFNRFLCLFVRWPNGVADWGIVWPKRPGMSFLPAADGNNHLLYWGLFCPKRT